MSTYPNQKVVSDATVACVCFLLPPGPKMIYLEGKKISGDQTFFFSTHFFIISAFVESGDLKVHLALFGHFSALYGSHSAC